LLNTSSSPLSERGAFDNESQLINASAARSRPVRGVLRIDSPYEISLSLSIRDATFRIKPVKTNELLLKCPTSRTSIIKSPVIIFAKSNLDIVRQSVSRMSQEEYRSLTASNSEQCETYIPFDSWASCLGTSSYSIPNSLLLRVSRSMRSIKRTISSC
jgi:hypothetical protein